MTQPDLKSYDRIIVATSFGKDSLAAFLHLFDKGADLSKIEWWHHDIDDSQASGHFMGWPFEQAYGKALADHFGIPLYLSAKDGGFRREMMRSNAPTAATWFETPDDIGRAGGKSSSMGTRLKFPQVTADLSKRWCSAYLKIGVADAALNNQPRFHNSRTLFITGERAQESPGRAKYEPFKPHRADRRHGRQNRHIDHWLPVHHWSEKDVWSVIEKHKIIPALPYSLGFSRFSCKGCIFGSADHFASIKFISPEMIDELADYEQAFGCTIKRSISIRDLAASGQPFPAVLQNPDLCRDVMNPDWSGSVTTENWTIPAGAFRSTGGPA